MNELHENDKHLAKELGVKALARLVGYTETGEPIELVFDADSGEYGWHIGGEYLKQASQRMIERYSQQFNQCTVV